MNTIISAIALFAIAIGVLIAFRARMGTKFEIRTADIIVALVPVGLLLFLTGKITRLEIANVAIESIVQASRSNVSNEVRSITSLPVDSIEVDPKAGVGDIPRLIRKGSEALSYSMGFSGYYGPAIERYFQELTESGSLQYCLINQPDGRFFGIADAQRIAVLVRLGDLPGERFAEWLKNSNEAALSDLPGFVPAASAIDPDTDKQTALRAMDRLGLEKLPVMDAAGKFVGLVDRSRLTSSILVDITSRLEAED